ncbi:hypothetical protein J6590_068083 [Homalodisca vitripennis]|nr:hypothetical protein J6590_068083 [Homalodisca vitripennis]
MGGWGGGETMSVNVKVVAEDSRDPLRPAAELGVTHVDLDHSFCDYVFYNQLSHRWWLVVPNLTAPQLTAPQLIAPECSQRQHNRINNRIHAHSATNLLWRYELWRYEAAPSHLSCHCF